MTLPPESLLPAPDARPEPPVAPPSTLRRAWRWPPVQIVIYLLLLWLAWRFVEHLRPLVTSVVIAYLAAHLTDPLLRRLEGRGVARPLGIGLIVLAFLAVLAGVVPLIVAVLRELETLVQALPQLVDTLSATLHRLADRYPALQSAQDQADTWIKANTRELPARASAVLGKLLSPEGALVSGVLGAAGWLGRLFVTLIIAIYMMAIYPAIGPFLLRLLPERYQAGAADLSGHVRRAVGGYFRGQITVALIIGLMIGVGLTVLRVPSSLAIGFLAALINIVPYLGVILSIIPALLLAIPLGLGKVIAVAVLFIAANQLEGHVIAPRVVSHSTHLSSLAVLLAILFGIELFGLLGAIIAVPAVATIKSLLDAYYYPSRSYRAVPNPVDRPETDGTGPDMPA